MKSYRNFLLVLFVSIFGSLNAGIATAKSRSALTAFSSEEELTDYLAYLRREMAIPPSNGLLEQIRVTAARREDSVTNTQTEGVDEGGLVKRHGDHLVILRRGRLLTISLKGGELKPVSWLDAFGPGINPESTWYDELLVYQDRVIVIGYSYERGGTELGFFRIDESGYLTYDTTFHLRSSDYYSSRNYASRLVDGKLVLYAPLPIGRADEVLPGIREWPMFGNAPARDTKDGFRSIASAARIFKPVRPLRRGDYPALHTVTTCDLGRSIDCSSISAIGSYGEVFYVSSSAVYIWLSDWAAETSENVQPGVVYRMPLNGALPTAMQVAGSPTDQFSFLEDAYGYLNVLVRAGAEGNAMWAAERSSGEVALFRTPLSKFGDASGPPDSKDYFALPTPPEGRFQNRFVGEYVLYGSGIGWGDDVIADNKLYVANTRTRNVDSVSLQHSIDRLEEMGIDALVVGADGLDNLHFSAIRLSPVPVLSRKHVIPGAGQAETRSHAFGYKVDGRSAGTVALPIIGNNPSYSTDESALTAAVVFLKAEKDAFRPLGQLEGTSTDLGKEGDLDRCVVSCVDWYGDSRPIFLRERIFAMLGYEIVEGVVRDGRIEEVARANFLPFVGR